jgi:XisI protein
LRHYLSDSSNIRIEIEPQSEVVASFQVIRGHLPTLLVFIHLDIKDGKIWIQRNMTGADLAQELVEMGVPKEDIVLGLQPLYKRPYTGYAIS